jgi:hypothetical protein
LYKVCGGLPIVTHQAYFTYALNTDIKNDILAFKNPEHDHFLNLSTSESAFADSETLDSGILESVPA